MNNIKGVIRFVMNFFPSFSVSVSKGQREDDKIFCYANDIKLDYNTMCFQFSLNHLKLDAQYFVILVRMSIMTQKWYKKVYEIGSIDTLKEIV